MSNLKGWSIKSKVITFLVGLCLLSISIIGIVVSTQINTKLKEGAKKELINVVSEKANQYNLIFKRLAEEVNSVKLFATDTLSRKETLSDLNKAILMPWVGDGTGDGVKKGYGSTKLNAQLESEVPKVQLIGKVLEGIGLSNELITLAYFVTADGLFVSGQDKVTEDIRQAEAWQPKNRPWFQKATLEQKTIWTKPYIDVATNNLVVTVASPLYDGKRNLLGVVAFDVLLKTIKDDILMIDLKYDGYPLLVGFDGRALVTPSIDKEDKTWDSNFEPENLLETQNSGLNLVIADMTKQKTGIGIYEDIWSEGKKYLAYAPLEGLDASVGVVVSENEVVAPVFDILKWLGIVAFIISFVAIVIGVSLGNSISKPISELTNLINDISNGTAELKTLTVIRNDELGNLTEAFNRLISSLKVAIKMK